MTLSKAHHISHVLNNMIRRRFEIHLQSKFHLHSSPRLINKETGCYKPCSYRKYNLIGDHQRPPTNINFTDGFMLWSFTDDILVGKTNDMKVYYWLYFVWKVETEQLIYPWQSLVAEFGGSLGLFLGFSLMTIWDTITALKNLKASKVFSF